MYNVIMVDYSLFIAILKHEITSIKMLGENFPMHSRINALIKTKQIKNEDDAQLIFIYKESPQFIDFFWRNILTENTQWLIIAPRNKTEAIIIYKELRSFGETIIVQSEEPIVIIKNLKPNFKQYFRQEILLPIEQKNLNDFLDAKDENQYDERLCQVMQGTEEEQIIQSIMSNSMYVYFGDDISSDCVKVCQMLANMKFYIIECMSQDNYKTKGFFVHRDYLEKTIIYKLTEYKTLKNVMKFNEIHIKMPVY